MMMMIRSWLSRYTSCFSDLWTVVSIHTTHFLFSFLLLWQLFPSLSFLMFRCFILLFGFSISILWFYHHESHHHIITHRLTSSHIFTSSHIITHHHITHQYMTSSHNITVGCRAAEACNGSEGIQALCHCRVRTYHQYHYYCPALEHTQKIALSHVILLLSTITRQNSRWNLRILVRHKNTPLLLSHWSHWWLVILCFDVCALMCCSNLDQVDIVNMICRQDNYYTSLFQQDWFMPFVTLCMFKFTFHDDSRLFDCCLFSFDFRCMFLWFFFILFPLLSSLCLAFLSLSFWGFLYKIWPPHIFFFFLTCFLFLVFLSCPLFLFLPPFGVFFTVLSHVIWLVRWVHVLHACPCLEHQVLYFIHCVQREARCPREGSFWLVQWAFPFWLFVWLFCCCIVWSCSSHMSLLVCIFDRVRMYSLFIILLRLLIFSCFNSRVMNIYLIKFPFPLLVHHLLVHHLVHHLSIRSKQDHMATALKCLSAWRQHSRYVSENVCLCVCLYVCMYAYLLFRFD